MTFFPMTCEITAHFLFWNAGWGLSRGWASEVRVVERRTSRASSESRMKAAAISGYSTSENELRHIRPGRQANLQGSAEVRTGTPPLCFVSDAMLTYFRQVRRPRQAEMNFSSIFQHLERDRAGKVWSGSTRRGPAP